MNIIEFIGLYFAYAFIQAVVIARYGIKETESPVFCVFFFMVIAPVVTIATLITCLGMVISWIVTAGVKK